MKSLVAQLLLGACCCSSVAEAAALAGVRPAAAAANSNSDGGKSMNANNADKRIVFLRHGRTYMNEYLGGKNRAFGSPDFSDVFSDEDRALYYQDSPLSPAGIRQAKALHASNPSFASDIELVVTSPLRRALQTFDVGIRPHLIAANKNNADDVPVIALPEAAERLYLVSDVGRSVPELREEYGYVDFETGFRDQPDDAWWYQSAGKPYAEWRPTGRGQRYACQGEPDDHFAERMGRLYQWLCERPESNIAVVCHWGVIDWMLDVDFDNCQWRQVALDDVRSPRIIVEEQQGLR